jgi:hypothetical protein
MRDEILRRRQVGHDLAHDVADGPLSFCHLTACYTKTLAPSSSRRSLRNRNRELGRIIQASSRTLLQTIRANYIILPTHFRDAKVDCRLALLFKCQLGYPSQVANGETFAH